VAIEFDPDDPSKAFMENEDKGTCYIQRRNSQSVSIKKHPTRQVYMNYMDQPEAALLLSMLAPEVNVNMALLRYESSCNSTEINGVCRNTPGSYVCECNALAEYIPTEGNASCVKIGDRGTYDVGEEDGPDEWRACQKYAFTDEGASSALDCYCPSGSDLRVTSWSNTTRECGRCSAGSWGAANSTCETCFPNSWSLPGTPDRQFCLCNQVSSP
jgi:hypothetical protein